MNDTDNTQPAASNAPTHSLCVVRKRKDGKSRWTRLGSAWPHKDGGGFNIIDDSRPLDGNLVLRVITKKKA